MKIKVEYGYGNHREATSAEIDANTLVLLATPFYTDGCDGAVTGGVCAGDIEYGLARGYSRKAPLSEAPPGSQVFIESRNEQDYLDFEDYTPEQNRIWWLATVVG